MRLRGHGPPHTVHSCISIERREAAILTEERLVVREAARYWWVFLVSGIAWLLIAWLVLRFNTTTIYNSFELVVNGDQMTGSYFNRNSRVPMNLVRKR